MIRNGFLRNLTLGAALLGAATASAEELRVTQSDPVTLDNGITYRTYTCKYATPETIEIEGWDEKISGKTFGYDIQWPEEGKAKGLKVAQEWIRKTIASNIDKPVKPHHELGADMPKFIKANIQDITGTYDPEEITYFEFEIRLSAPCLDLLSIEFSRDERGHMQWSHGGVIRKSTINLSTGDTLSWHHLPSISKMRPLLQKHLMNGDTKVTRRNAGDCTMWNYEELPYPNNLPIATPQGMRFVWDVNEIGAHAAGSFDALIPYEELVPIASPELLQFFPPKYRPRPAKDEPVLLIVD